MTTSIFEKILYGIKVANDNIIVLNEKVDALTQSLSYVENEPNEADGANQIVGIN